MSGKDLFSIQAADYAKFRPTYPSSLFTYLAKLCTGRRAAWDCATGNGQAAFELANHFQLVYATDLSQKQISQSRRHPLIRYSQGRAEHSGLQPGSVDLITVAQAFHWFDHRLFFREARRIVRPEGGILAIWMYEGARISDEINLVISDFSNKVVGGYGEPEIKMLKPNFLNLKIPFQEITPPTFEMCQVWSLNQLKGYLFTWSAAQTMIRKTGKNPVEEFSSRLDDAWGDPLMLREVRWPMLVRVGRLL